MNTVKINGFTLIETLIVATIAGGAAVSGIKLATDKYANELAEEKGADFAKIISSVDNRIATDGYYIDKWTKTNWTTEDLNSNLLAKQLNATNSTGKGCGLTDWNPVNAVDSSFKSMQCDGLWQKTPYGLEANANLTTDSGGVNIDNFELVLSFTDDEHFKSEFKQVRKMLTSARRNASNGFAGKHTFSFIDKTTEAEITNTQCIEQKSNCALRGELNRSGGAEYIRADGKNSIIGNHLSFVETEGSSPLKCARWSKGTTGWVLNSADDVNDENCGVGIYKKSGEPLLVELNVDNTTATSIMLDKACATLAWDNSISSVVANGSSPCGLFNDGTEAVQIVDNTMASKGLFNLIKSNDIEVATMNITDRAYMKSLVVDTELQVLQKAILKEVEAETLTVIGNTSLGYVEADRLKIENDITAQNISATVGNFDNINSQIAEVKSAVNTVYNGLQATNKLVASNEVRITALEKSVGSLGSIGIEALKDECNSRSNGYLGTGTSQCSGANQGGTYTYVETADYYWNSSTESCNYNVIKIKTDSNCYYQGGGHRD